MVVTFALAIVGVMAITLSMASAAEAPVKEVVVSHFGWDVNGTKEKEAGASQEEKNICTVLSGDECKPGKQSSAPGGFNGAQGVAVAHDGEVDIADFRNDRIQRFGAEGLFAGTFGVSGGEAGQLSKPHSIAIDRATNNNVYVQDLLNWRVDEFTPTGVFVLMIGKEVNETKELVVKAKSGTPTDKEIEEENLCTEKEIKTEGVKCKAGVQNTAESPEPGAFNFASGVYGNLITVGGPEGLLYVADEHRVQEFDVSGKFVREIREPLESISPASNSKATALTVDNNRDVFLTYSVNFTNNVIREFDASGKEIHQFLVSPRHPEQSKPEIEVVGIALDGTGRLAVLEGESYYHLSPSLSELRAAYGSLDEVGTTNLRLITEFANEPTPETGEPGRSSSAVAFDEVNNMYAATGENEVIIYHAESVGEPLQLAPACAKGSDRETDATFDCTLNGEVDPWSVSETTAWFEWGKACSPLGTETVHRAIVSTEKIDALLGFLRPNEAYCYSVAAFDQRVHLPERPLTSEKEPFVTPSVPPRIVGAPSAEFVGSSSAVMFGKLNPENSATEYFFEYGPCDNKNPYVSRTKSLTSSTYGSIGATLEATGLQPATTYCYRLSAINEQHETAPEGTAGQFTTAPLPVPHAVTGAATAVTATSALVSGTVNPDGQPAAYMFELGVYRGAGTQYGIVFSGPVAESDVPVEESLSLTGLEPGTTYAYRISVRRGNEGPINGETNVFVTAGLPVAIPSPALIAQLGIPKIVFPKEVTPGHLTNAQKLANALKLCKKKKSKKERRSCEKSAHKKYGSTSKKKATSKKK